MTRSPSFIVSGIAKVNGRAHVDGSLTVTDQSTLVADARVKRSIRLRVSASAFR